MPRARTRCAVAEGTALFAADGGTIDPRGRIQRGAISQAKGGALVYDDDPLTIEYRRDASVHYETPAGSATYAEDEIRTGAVVEKGRSSKLWLILFTVALGLLVSTKWYGVMGFGVSFIVLIWVAASGLYFKNKLRPALWGNPAGLPSRRGARDDLAGERDGLRARLATRSGAPFTRPRRNP